MKRILSILLVLLLCVGVFAACAPQEETPAATLDDAKTYLSNMYKDSASNLTNDYDLVGKVIVSGVTFTVTWKSDVSDITIKESSKKDFWTVDLPDVNATEKAYVLTATITDAEGNTATVTLNRTLPVFEKVAGVVTNPVAETAYKLFLEQKNVGKTLFLLAEDTGKFIKTTIDPKAAADFYVEAADNGVKVYTLVNGAKKYLSAAATLDESTGKVSKSITYGDTGSVFTYNADINAWYTVVDNIKYCIGTYSTYETVSISEDSYYTPENTGVEQFPMSFILKADGEAMNPTEGPKDPTELTPIKDVAAMGAAMEHNTYTVEKYLIKGTITEIKSEQYGNMYVEDADGNSIYVYGVYSKDGSVRFDKMDPQPKVGDVITIMGIVGQYNDEPQIKNGWTMDLEVVACEHTYSGDCDTKCNKCGETRTTTVEHTFDNACDAECNVCAETRDASAHVYTGDCDTTCDVCGAERKAAEHTYDNACDATCNVCGEEREPSAHVYDFDCDATCNVCGAEREAAPHTYDFDCDATCNICSSTRAVDCVDENEDGKCDYCGEDMPDAAQIEANHIAHEKGQISFKEVNCKSDPISLVTAGRDYTDVTIAWASKSANAVIADGKLTFTFTAETQTITLTATFTCGDTVVSVDYTVTVAAHTYDNACDAECNVCGATRTPADHVYDNACDADCNVCGATRTPADHADANSDGKCDSCSIAMGSAPKTGVAYKWYLAQKNTGKILYFKGEMDGFYFATTENAAEAVDVYLESVEGGYKIYFEVNGTKNYIYIENTGEHYNIKFGQTASVFVYDALIDAMVTEVEANGEKEGGTFYIGTYGTYKTLSASNTDQIDTNFVARFTETAIDPATCEHDFAEANCNDPKICKICLTTEGSALGHTESNAEGKCDRCGISLSGISVKDALEAESGTEVIITGTVSGIYQAYNSEHNNTSFYLTDNNGDTILCYRITGEWAVGDVVKVTGEITVYGGANQIAQGGTAEKLGTHTEHIYADATCTDPKTCIICDATEGNALGHTEPNSEGKCDRCGFNVSIKTADETFAIAASEGNLVDKTITWNATNFTMVGAQASSTSVIRTEDTDHFRVYKSSTFTITCNKGMMKVVITAMSDSYATAMLNSLTTEGVEAVQNGSVVTFTVSDTAITELAFTASAQFRISNITVTYVTE